MAETPGGSVVKTELDELLGEIEGQKQWLSQKVAEGLAPMQEELDRMVAFMEKAEKQLKDSRRSSVLKLDQHNGLRIKSGRFAGMGTLELHTLLATQDDLHIKGMKAGAQHAIFEEARTSVKELAGALDHDSVDEWRENAIRQRAMMSGLAAGSPAVRRFAETVDSWATEMHAQVRRAMDSTTAGSGDELVPTFEAAQLWMDVNLDTLVLPVLNQVAMPTNPYDWPLQLGDTNWYPTSENIQGATTDVATAKRTLTAQGLKTGVPFSDELEEDSIVAFASELRSSLARNAAEVIDDVLLNADTTVTNNINADGATIAATDAGKGQWLLGWDGLRHISLIDNTGQGAAHAAAVSAAAYNSVLLRMGKYAVPRRAGEVVFITDPQTRIASLSIGELETVDSGMGSTLSSGELASIYGNPIITSEQLRLTATDGKVTDGAAGTEGQILGLNTSQYRVGFRRGITMETDREPGKSQTTLYVTFRIAFEGRNANASDTATALQYDVSQAAGA